MSYALLEKEIETLPAEAVAEAVNFIRFLKFQFSEKEPVSQKKSMYGVWKDQPFFMSDDFDEPLDDFTEYM